MIHGAEPISSTDFNKGLVTRSDFLKGDINASPNTMDVKWNFDSSLHKRFGCSSTNSVSLGQATTGGWVIDTNSSLSTSIVSYWKLDEVGDTRFDSSDGNALADINTTGSITGIRGLAALFIASASNGLVAGNPTNLQTGNINFSMEAWVYLNSTSTTVQQTIISKKDPNLDSTTVLLLHCDGANSSNSIIDSSLSAHIIGSHGGVKLSSTPNKFGSSSIHFIASSSQNINLDGSSDFAFGNNDFTVDFWVNFNSIPDNTILYDGRPGGTNGAYFLIEMISGSNILTLGLESVTVITGTTPLSLNTWYHIALTRFSHQMKLFLNGVQEGSTYSDTENFLSGGAGTPTIGSSVNNNVYLDGYLDEIRVINGVAKWISNFTPPAQPYGVLNYEYWLYVDTNQKATFAVSSTGSANTGLVSSSSFGTLNTANWYNVIAWHSNNSHIGISVNLSATTASYNSGVAVGNAPFVLGSNSSNLTANATTYMDGRIDETGFWTKVLSSQERSDLYGGGSGNTFTGSVSAMAWASFDFGASGIRWLTISEGTGLLASSNLGVTFVNITTGGAGKRTQNYQSLTRSKNVLIATSDSYDATLYWAGSAGTTTQLLAPNSAPSAKFATNYQGFLILLNFMNSNGAIRNRGFAYADENLQLTDSWGNSFDIPSSADDEITASFILYKFLYVSTRYTIYRVAFTGGNPDWTYLKIKDWGFVPRTVQIVSLKGGGQVAIGMDWNRRMRAFDGFDDMFVSDNVENDNGICDFAMQKISYAGSGLLVSHAVLNPVTQEYRLNVAIGANSTQTTHGIILNARNLAMYPYSNQGWQTMCIAQSNNQNYLMAADRSGFVYILDSGNLDGAIPINEMYDSPTFFSKIPEGVSKGKQLNMFFAPLSSGTIYYQERFNLSNIWSPMKKLADQHGVSVMTGTENSIKLQRGFDLKATYNTYQFRLTSSAGTAMPWAMDRLDFLQQGFGIGQG